MSKLVPPVVLALIIVVSASAQIQKSPHNRIYVDEDYEWLKKLEQAVK